jgi:hypothetical protein
MVEHSFINTNIDHWRTPLIFYGVSTGKSNIGGKDILFTPNPFYAWVLPYLYLTLLAGVAFLSWYWLRQSDYLQGKSKAIALFTLSRRLGWGLLLILPVIAVGFLAYQNNLSSRIYDVNTLQHLVGQPLADPAARDGHAWWVDPVTDPPQKATYGPFDIYDQGQYHVTFRMKLLETVEPGLEVARLRVAAAAKVEALTTQALRSNRFSQPGLYHDFVLSVNNPRRQALSFEVDYLGIAALAVDDVTITKIEN